MSIAERFHSGPSAARTPKGRPGADFDGYRGTARKCVLGLHVRLIAT